MSYGPRWRIIPEHAHLVRAVRALESHLVISLNLLEKPAMTTIETLLVDLDRAADKVLATRAMTNVDLSAKLHDFETREAATELALRGILAKLEPAPAVFVDAVVAPPVLHGE